MKYELFELAGWDRGVVYGYELVEHVGFDGKSQVTTVITFGEDNIAYWRGRCVLRTSLKWMADAAWLPLLEEDVRRGAARSAAWAADEE